MIFTVYASSKFRTAACEIDAETPAEALGIAHALIASKSAALPIDGKPVVAVEVHSRAGEPLTVWRPEGLLTETRLLAAARNVVDRWEKGDLIWDVHELAIAVAAVDAAELLRLTRREADQQRAWLLSLPGFIGLAILPVRTFRHACVTLDDVCTPNHAERWSVWGVHASGGRSRLEDFATHAEASAFAATLRRIYPHLKESP